MERMRVVHSTGAEGVLEAGALERFSSGFRGEVLRPGDRGYDDVRRVFNAAIEKKPALIARCAGVADVMTAVKFAREHNLLVAVRGGGHNVAGNAVCGGGLVIDLSRLTAVRVDPVRRTARAEGGTTWGILDHETQAFGLATTGGIVSTTGIAGLTLGGGIGWLARSHGLACDNLLSADIVTADGRFLTASSNEHPDLFWGLRGGGGNFGIVTSFEYRLHPVGPLLGGLMLFPSGRGRELLRCYRELTAAATDQLAAYAVLIVHPDAGPVAVVAVCYNGDPGHGRTAIDSLRELGTPVADLIRPMTYGEVQRMLDASYPAGLLHYWKSNFLVGLSGEAIEAMCGHFAAIPSPKCHMAIEHLGGAIRQVDGEVTAFAHRDFPYNLLILGVTTDAAEYEASMRWARGLWEAMRPFCASGVYVNYLGQEGDEGVARVQAAYGPGRYQRLVTLKQKYDPDNFFRLNQNIRPSL
jgi:FAD/FMN-containing dehydrogenase